MKKILWFLKRIAMMSMVLLGIPMVADTTSTFFDSQKSVFKLYDGSQLRALTAQIKEMTGLPGQLKMNDVTTFGSTSERPGPSIFINHFTMKLVFNQITSTGSWTVLNGMFSNKALRAFEYYPVGETSGDTKISGNAYLAKLEVTSRVGDYITCDCEFHCDNGVTIGTAT